MPVVNIDMLDGKTREQKKRLIESVTKAVCESVGCEANKVTVVLREVPKENWGAGGVQKG